MSSKKEKTLQELTLKDNFMFAAVMMESDNCRRFLEMVLEIPIDRVEISYEKTIVYHPEYKGIRMDVYAKDEKNTHFDVEMQVEQTDTGKRSRYYHSQIDMEMLVKGLPYKQLADAYVIFICGYDPFGQGKYRYTFRNTCVENNTLLLKDGNYTIILNTEGRNAGDVPEELEKFLKFVRSDLKDSQKDFEDDYVRQLQNTIYHVKQSREMGDRYMLLQALLMDEHERGKAEGRAEGKAEGKAESTLELLEDFGEIPEKLRESIFAERDEKILGSLLKAAAKVESMEQFLKAYHQIMGKEI